MREPARVGGVRRRRRTTAGSPRAIWLSTSLRSDGAIRPGSILPGISLIVAILLALFFLPSPWGLVAVLGAACLEVVELWWGLRLARRRSSVGAQTLIGREAIVVRALDPEGQVAIDGERWTARSAAPVPGRRQGRDRVDRRPDARGQAGVTASAAATGGALRRVCSTTQ